MATSYGQLSVIFFSFFFLVTETISLFEIKIASRNVLTDSQIGKLQRVQNTCARLICNLPKFAHVTPLLRELHWLPIRQRNNLRC